MTIAAARQPSVPAKAEGDTGAEPTEEGVNVLERELDRAAEASSDGWLRLPHMQLESIPPQVLSERYAHLTGLDLSHNEITSIPSEVSSLVSLKQIWIQHNPLSTVPLELSLCERLEVVDISYTNIAHIPPELSLLTHLETLNWKGTPLAMKMKANDSNIYRKYNLSEYKTLLQENLRRDSLKSDLIEKLSTKHFTQDVALVDYINRIERVVDNLSSVFGNLGDFEMFCRQASRLLPNRLHLVNERTPLLMKKKVEIFKTETARKRLAADVDIKVK